MCFIKRCEKSKIRNFKEQREYIIVTKGGCLGIHSGSVQVCLSFGFLE